MNFAEEFKNPPLKYRGKPFWFWNGDMNEAEIDHQLKEMADKGLGGVFICARQGLKVPYLSNKWFDLIRYACEKAKEYGLEAWLYDEYPYPSGMSGGEVLLEHPDAGHKILNHKTVSAKGGEEVVLDLGWSEIIYLKAVKICEDGSEDWDSLIDLTGDLGNLQVDEIYQESGMTRYNYKRFFTYTTRKVLTTTLPEGSWRIEAYTQTELNDFKYYGGYFDPCNKQAVDTFIRTTHERYKDTVGGDFGKNIFGMFSDETGLLSAIPWSPKLPEYFEQKNGYSLSDVMPALHSASFKDAYKIRYDYYNTVHELFRETYHKTVAGWCQDNSLLYATEVPSMRLTTQIYSDIVGGDPGHEKLGKSLEWTYDYYNANYRSNPKAISSMQRQLGHEFAMDESFHSVGWSMTLQDAKWMIDRLGASGINFYNFHAFYYTIEAITKHDAPPSQFLQNPYWKHYNKFADFVGRMGEFISKTEPLTKVAVLDPVTSMWTLLGNPNHGFPYVGEDEKEKLECESIKKDWVHICKQLLFNQIEYDHLDAEMLEKATVENGSVRIGNAVYSTVILPPCTSMETGAYEKLKELAECGGHVAALGLLPYRAIDDTPDVPGMWKELFHAANSNTDGYWGKASASAEAYGDENCRFFTTDGSLREAGIDEEWIAWLRAVNQDVIELYPAKEAHKDFISTIRRGADGDLYFFLSNQGRLKTSVDVRTRLPYGFEVKELNMEDGSIEAHGPGAASFTVCFEPYQSRCICLAGSEAAGEPLTCLKTAFDEEKIVVSTEKPMRVSVEGGNIMRFENFEVSTDQKEWMLSPVKTFIEQCAAGLKIDSAAFTYRGEFGTPKKIGLNYPMKAYFRTSFKADYVPEDLAFLMDRRTIEDTFTIYMNGQPLTKADFKPTFVDDQNNILCPVADKVKAGENELFIEVDITKDSDGIRDPLYLYGDFELERRDGDMVMVKPSRMAAVSGSYIEGYPYYSGTFTFSTAVKADKSKFPEKFYLAFDFGNSIYNCLEVLVNGVSLGVKAYTPYIWEGDSGLLKDGENEVTLKLTNSLANMLDGTYFDYDEHKLVRI